MGCIRINSNTERVRNELPKPAILGSCGLYIVCGALRDATISTDGKLEKTLKATWKLLQDSPAQSDMYVLSSLLFC